MSKFARNLEAGIINSGMTEKQLARISGFTRSYIALMKNGQRVSPDVEKMTRLIKALNLSLEEYDSLWEEYMRARMGNGAYERNAAVIDLIRSFDNESHAEVKSFCKYEIPDIKTIDNRLDMEYMIRAIIENESAKQDGFVHIIMQGDGNLLTGILPEICKDNKDLKIDHIVCMEKYIGTGTEDDTFYNLRMLKELVPVMVFSDSENYKIYYYYDHISSRFHSGMLLSYMVLTSDCLLCMNSQMDRGMFTRDAEVRQLYEEMFQKHKRKCVSMFQHIRDLTDMQSCLPQQEEVDDITYSLAQQPCFGVLNVMGFVKRYCSHETDPVMSFLEDSIKKNVLRIEEKGKMHIAYCSKEGIDRFAQEGMVDELAEYLTRPLSPKDRKKILQMLLDKIDCGSCELYFFEEGVVQLPKTLFISAYSISSVLLMYLSVSQQSRVILTESSLTRILYETLRDLLKSTQVCDKDVARDYIEKTMLSIVE